jgi:pimeloyl-ACP methyl ester carboxylesterase
MKTIKTDDLIVSYDVYGTRSERTPILLLHGFPDDASAWKEVGALLAGAGEFAIAPHVRGCGPTVFASENTPRSGQPSARARDALAFLGALGLDTVVLVGQDWGATTAQALAILHPHRVKGLAILNGHGLFNMGPFAQGRIPTWETIHAGWYQWLFQTPLAKPLLSADLEGFIRHAWTNWSPGWRFTEDDLQAVVHSAQNPDWLDVVLSAYGPPDHAAADSQDSEANATLAKLPPITCPTLNLQGANDGVDLHVDTQLGQEDCYKGPFSSEVLESCGHFLHRERPEAVAQKILGFLSQIPV